jgi:ketosteroid isomerase-like protein
MSQHRVVEVTSHARCTALLSAAVLIGALGVHASPLSAQRGATASETAAQRTLFRLESDWARAVVNRDSAAMSRLVAPRWVYSDESGVMNRAEGIKAFTAGTDTVREASNSEMKAIVYPNTAVVIGILHMKGRGPAGPFTRRFRYTDTWAKLDGRWQCIASQDYLMPEKKAGP